VITTSHILKLISKHRRWIVRRRLKRGFGDSIGGFGRDCRSVSTASKFHCDLSMSFELANDGMMVLLSKEEHSYWLMIK